MILILMFQTHFLLRILNPMILMIVLYELLEVIITEKIFLVLVLLMCLTMSMRHLLNVIKNFYSYFSSDIMKFWLILIICCLGGALGLFLHGLLSISNTLIAVCSVCLVVGITIGILAHILDKKFVKLSKYTKLTYVSFFALTCILIGYFSIYQPPADSFVREFPFLSKVDIPLTRSYIDCESSETFLILVFDLSPSIFRDLYNNLNLVNCKLSRIKGNKFFLYDPLFLTEESDLAKQSVWFTSKRLKSIIMRGNTDSLKWYYNGEQEKLKLLVCDETTGIFIRRTIDSTGIPFFFSLPHWPASSISLLVLCTAFYLSIYNSLLANSKRPSCTSRGRDFISCLFGWPIICRTT